MAKKRKSDASKLDEVDRNMYSTFCGAASSLSQLYTHAMHRQRLSFQAGERHAMEKLYNWVLRQQQGGVRVTANDILAYMQNAAEFGADEPSSFPRQTVHHQPQSNTAAMHSAAASNFLISSHLCGATAAFGQGLWSGISEQSKNNVLSDGLSSPLQSLQRYHLAQGNDDSNTPQNKESTFIYARDQKPQSSGDTMMDMHDDNAGHDFP